MKYFSGNEGYWWVAGLLIRGIQSSPDRYACMMTRYAISYALCDFVQTNWHIIICDFGLWCQTNDILSVCSRIGSFLLNLPIHGLLSFRHFNGNGFSVIREGYSLLNQFVLLIFLAQISLGINVSDTPYYSSP